jgi:hypothetical protein
MRLGSVRPRSLIGENKALMGDVRTGRESDPYGVASRFAVLNPPRLQPSPTV